MLLTPKRRIIAALFVSFIVHATLFMLPGTGGVATKSVMQSVLSVNLVSPIQPPQSSEAMAPLPHPVAGAADARFPTVDNRATGLVTAKMLEDRYFQSYEVDKRAVLAFSELDSELGNFSAADLKGSIKVMLLISAEGKVDSVKVLQAENSIFNGIVLNALLNSRFKPAEKDGKKVKSQKIIEINLGVSG